MFQCTATPQCSKNDYNGNEGKREKERGRHGKVREGMGRKEMQRKEKKTKEKKRGEEVWMHGKPGCTSH